MEESTRRESRKQALRQESTEYKKAIERQLQEGYSEVQRMGRLILIGGIVGLSAYTLFSFLGAKKTKNKKKNGKLLQGQIEARESSLPGLIKEKIALFLLSLALEKLKNHLLKEKPENDTTHPPETSSAAESEG